MRATGHCPHIMWGNDSRSQSRMVFSKSWGWAGAGGSNHLTGGVGLSKREKVARAQAPTHHFFSSLTLPWLLRHSGLQSGLVNQTLSHEAAPSQALFHYSGTNQDRFCSLAALAAGLCLSWSCTEVLAKAVENWNPENQVRLRNGEGAITCLLLTWSLNRFS